MKGVLIVELKAGHKLMCVGVGKNEEIHVFCGMDFVGKLEGVPQDPMMCVNGVARSFVEAEAAKYGLLVAKPDRFTPAYVFRLVK